MGYFRHDTIVAIGYLPADDGSAAELERQVDELRAEMRDPQSGADESRLLIGPMSSVVNFYTIYAYLPDGSKEGWDTSDRHDEWRERFHDLLNATGRFNVLTASFGGDDADWLTASVDTYGEHDVTVNSAQATS